METDQTNGESAVAGGQKDAVLGVAASGGAVDEVVEYGAVSL